jgi:hypothetical protein
MKNCFFAPDFSSTPTNVLLWGSEKLTITDKSISRNVGWIKRSGSSGSIPGMFPKSQGQTSLQSLTRIFPELAWGFFGRCAPSE